MEYSEGRMGRVFALRLSDGDRLPDAIEAFARDKGVKEAACLLLGGANGGRVVVGPEDPAGATLRPMLARIEGAHEIAAMGTLFPDEAGVPRLHMHAALGRGETARVGCVRPGVDIWLVGEVLILEIVGLGMLRKKDPKSGLALLYKEA